MTEKSEDIILTGINDKIEILPEDEQAEMTSEIGGKEPPKVLDHSPTYYKSNSKYYRQECFQEFSWMLTIIGMCMLFFFIFALCCGGGSCIHGTKRYRSSAFPEVRTMIGLAFE